MARKLEDTDFQFAVPNGVAKRRKISDKNNYLNGKLSPLSRSSSFYFNTPSSYHDNLNSAFQSLDQSPESSSMPRMSSFVVKDSTQLSKRSLNKDLKADKLSDNQGNLFFDKEYQDFIAPLVVTRDNNGDSVDLDITPPVGDLFSDEENDDDNKEDLDITPPVGDLFSDEEDDDDNKEDLDITPPVGDLFSDDDDEDEGNDENNKDSVVVDVILPVGDVSDKNQTENENKNKKKDKNTIELEKNLPVSDLFNENANKKDDDLDKKPHPVDDLLDDEPHNQDNTLISSSNSPHPKDDDITPPVSPGSFEDDVPVFDPWKITNSDGIILKTGDDEVDDPQVTPGASRVFHVLPGDDQVQLTLTL